MPTHVFPSREIRVIIFATNFKKVRMIRNKHRCYARSAQRIRNRVFPNLHRSPRTPGEIQGSNKQIMACRHTGQRSRVMPIKDERIGSKTIQMGGCELRSPIGPQKMPIKAVKENNNHMFRRQLRLRKLVPHEHTIGASDRSGVPLRHDRGTGFCALRLR